MAREREEERRQAMAVSLGTDTGTPPSPSNGFNAKLHAQSQDAYGPDHDRGGGTNHRCRRLTDGGGKEDGRKKEKPQVLLVNEKGWRVERQH